MPISEHITLCSQRFTLQGVICHHGDQSPNLGHYVAVAKHGEGPEPFFLYNDDVRREIPRADLACTMQLLNGYVRQEFHASALLYELLDPESVL